MPGAEEYNQVDALIDPMIEDLIARDIVFTAAVGGLGSYLESVTIIPLSSAGGAVTVLDGTVSIIAIPAAAYAPQPLPITLQLGIRSQSTSSGGFKITTGSSVSCIAVGKFAND